MSVSIQQLLREQLAKMDKMKAAVDHLSLPLLQPVPNSLYEMLRCEIFYCCREFRGFISQSKLQKCAATLAADNAEFFAAAMVALLSAITVEPDARTLLRTHLDQLAQEFRASGAKCMHSQFSFDVLPAERVDIVKQIAHCIMAIIDLMPALIAIDAVLRAKDVAEQSSGASQSLPNKKKARTATTMKDAKDDTDECKKNK